MQLKSIRTYQLSLALLYNHCFFKVALGSIYLNRYLVPAIILTA